MQDLAKVWEAEALLDPTDQEVNRKIIQATQDNMTFKGKRYWVGMPWIDSGVDPNFRQVLYRFNKLITHLNQEDLFDRYDAEIQQLKDNNHIEIVRQDDRTKGCYLAHREVLKEGSATTKIRLVFDGSGHSSGNKSLNECMSKGVDMNPLMLQVLALFRMGRYGIIADLKQAFLQIRMHERDRDYFKFLWIENGRLVTYRFTSVPFGATASPYLLNVVKQSHFDRHREEFPIVNVLEKAMYVDDVIIAVNSKAEIENLHEQTTALFAKCSMGVHKWRCSEVETDQALAGNDTPTTVKVLGTKWDVHADTLGVRFEIIASESVTKRIVLRQIGSLYDPLGIAGPVVCAFKMLMQQLTIDQLGWYAPIKEETNLFRKLQGKLSLTEQICIPRCIGINAKDCVLATFCDASTKAYGAVVYALNLKTMDRVLVASRSRLNPVKQMTVPRAELMSAVIGAELTSRVKKWTGIESYPCCHRCAPMVSCANGK